MNIKEKYLIELYVNNKFRGVIVMGNFINAAFPWVAFGIFIANYLTYIDSKKSKNKVK